MLGPEIPLSKQRLAGQGAVAPRFRWCSWHFVLLDFEFAFRHFPASLLSFLGIWGPWGSAHTTAWNSNRTSKKWQAKLLQQFSCTGALCSCGRSTLQRPTMAQRSTKTKSRCEPNNHWPFSMRRFYGGAKGPNWSNCSFKIRKQDVHWDVQVGRKNLQSQAKDSLPSWWDRHCNLQSLDFSEGHGLHMLSLSMLSLCKCFGHPRHTYGTCSLAVRLKESQGGKLPKPHSPSKPVKAPATRSDLVTFGPRQITVES